MRTFQNKVIVPDRSAEIYVKRHKVIWLLCTVSQYFIYLGWAAALLIVLKYDPAYMQYHIVP